MQNLFSDEPGLSPELVRGYIQTLPYRGGGNADRGMRELRPVCHRGPGGRDGDVLLLDVLPRERYEAEIGIVKKMKYEIQIAEAVSMVLDQIPDEKWATIVESQFMSETMEKLIEHLNTVTFDPDVRHYDPTTDWIRLRSSVE